MMTDMTPTTKWFRGLCCPIIHDSHITMTPFMLSFCNTGSIQYKACWNAGRFHMEVQPVWKMRKNVDFRNPKNNWVFWAEKPDVLEGFRKSRNFEIFRVFGKTSSRPYDNKTNYDVVIHQPTCKKWQHEFFDVFSRFPPTVQKSYTTFLKHVSKVSYKNDSINVRIWSRLA